MIEDFLWVLSWECYRSRSFSKKLDHLSQVIIILAKAASWSRLKQEISCDHLKDHTSQTPDVRRCGIWDPNDSLRWSILSSLDFRCKMMEGPASIPEITDLHLNTLINLRPSFFSLHPVTSSLAFLLQHIQIDLLLLFDLLDSQNIVFDLSLEHSHFFWVIAHSLTERFSLNYSKQRLWPWDLDLRFQLGDVLVHLFLILVFWSRFLSACWKRVQTLLLPFLILLLSFALLTFLLLLSFARWKSLLRLDIQDVELLNLVVKTWVLVNLWICQHLRSLDLRNLVRSQL